MKVKLNNVRYSYLNCYTPRVNKGQPEVDEKGNDKRRFSVSAIFDKDSPDHKEMTRAIEQVARDQWGEKAEGVLKTLFAGSKVCIKDGNSRLDEEGNPIEGYEGKMFVNASSPAEKPPIVFNRFGTRVTAETKGMLRGEERGPLSGDYGQVMLDIWPQDNQFGRRINATLVGIALSKFGEPLGRRELTEDDVRAEFTFAEPVSIMED